MHISAAAPVLIQRFLNKKFVDLKAIMTVQLSPLRLGWLAKSRCKVKRSLGLVHGASMQALHDLYVLLQAQMTRHSHFGYTLQAPRGSRK